MIDINQVRKDTPHCQDKLFFNSAGASLVPSVVTERMKTYLDEEAKLGGYKLGLGDRIQAEIGTFYTEVSKLLNCNERNIAYSINASDGYAQSLFSIDWKRGDIVLTTDDDYISNQAQLKELQKRFGIQSIRMRNLENGEIDLNHLSELVIKHKPKLISVTHIPTNTGKIQNVDGVGEICDQNDILFIIDACQSAGQLPLDVKKIKCDFLVSSGRKFLRGPRATGFLYVSDKVLERNYLPHRQDGRGFQWISATTFKPYDSAIRYETWEQNYACVLGLKESIKYANNIGLENIYNYNQSLLSQLRSSFSSISGMNILDNGLNKANIFTFIIDGKEKQNIIDTLERNDVYFSVAFRGSALIDFDKKGTDWAIRISPHYFNTLEEIERLAAIVKSI